MSLTFATRFECPYCMTYNDLDVDEVNDIDQHQIVDCQICCQPIEVMVVLHGDQLQIIAKRDDE